MSGKHLRRLVILAIVGCTLPLWSLAQAFAAPPDLGPWKPTPLDFAPIRQTGPDVVFDTYYRGVDLFSLMGAAKWYAGKGQDGTGGRPITFAGGWSGAGFPIFLPGATLEDGSRPKLTLCVHPRQENEGVLRAYLPVELPPGGGKIVARVGFGDGSSSKGVDFIIGFLSAEPGAQHVEIMKYKALYDQKLDTMVADLTPVAGQEGWLTFTAQADVISEGDWSVWDSIQMSFAHYVVRDFLGEADAASWSSSAGAITFGAEPQPSGAVKWVEPALMSDGRIYGGNNLLTQPGGREYFIQGTFPDVHIPKYGGTFRARLGYPKGGGDGSGFMAMLAFIDDEGVHVLSDWVQGAQNAPLAVIDVSLKPCAGRDGSLVLYVNGRGYDGAHDDVIWVEARIYTR